LSSRYSAADDIEGSAQIQSLLEDIWVARFAKTRKGLESTEIIGYALRWNNLTGLEVNHLRQFLVPAIDHFHRLGETPDETDDGSSSSSSSTSVGGRHTALDVSNGSTDPPPRKLRRR